MAGNAARIGAQELLKRIRPVAAEMLDCPDASLIFSDNQIYSTIDSASEKAIFFGDLASACFKKGISLFAHGWYKSPATTWDEHTGQGDAYYTYVYGANLAEVEVDLVTGQVKVTRFISSHDIGRTLNLNGAKGQIYGGVAMGLGYALLEDYIQEDGIPALSNFDEYLLPTICDLPDIDIVLIENPDSLGPFGAKSLGEPACELAAPAIVNAVANATGLRVRDLPLTLERVLLGKSLVRNGARGSEKSRSEKK
jgi:CO/xanthine dehydrogenase Mo-binding subunit